MAHEITGNTPAFPVAEDINWNAGITKRELFAAMAMQGLLASDQEPRLHSTAIAELAADAADSVIAELVKEQK